MPVAMQREDRTTIGGVERRHRPSYAEFERDYLQPNKPVLLTGCMDDWPALAKWSPEFFQREHGSAPVTIGERTWSMAEFIDMVLASTPDRPAPYLKDAVVRRIDPALLRDIEPFTEYCFPNWLLGLYVPRSIRHLLNSAQIELFLGGPGTRLGNVHFDYIHSHTVLCQVHGRKEFTLFAPEDTPYLYADRGMSAITNVDAVDPERYPLFARATPIRFVQEPGEILFVPKTWWHTTRMLSVSIAVGVNFANATNWSDVTADVCDQVAGPRRLCRVLVRGYLSAIGWWKRIQGRWAGARRLGIRPRREGC